MKIWYDVEPNSHKVNDAGHKQLENDWCFHIDQRTIWIPAGYVMDGASIPRIFWNICGAPFDPVNEIGAWAHDYLYLTHLTDKKTADECAFQIWRQAGKSLWMARTMWFAVSKCAWFAWKNNKEDELELTKLRAMIASNPNKDKFDKV